MALSAETMLPKQWPKAWLAQPSHLRWTLHAIVLIVVAIVFWPVVHGSFVWDDWRSFHDTPWLTQGDLWMHYIFKGFNDWTYYFRPLGVLVLTAEVRLFDDAPGPMHAVSLAMHLIDTSLVGLLAWNIGRSITNQTNRAWTTTGCMALYGLHPLLIEPVSWIGCQFDLLATMFMLIGLLANFRIQAKTTRAVVLGILFFLAACAKESAIAFPLILAIWNWTLIGSNESAPSSERIKQQLRRNALSYGCIFLAGVAYLVLRHSMLGSLGKFGSYGITPFGRYQEICFTYLRYLRIMLWPMGGMSPIHHFIESQLNRASIAFIARDAAASFLVIVSIFCTIKYRSAWASLILTITAGLLPVLHIIPGDFDHSIYHERYAMTALATGCAMLPALWRPLPLSDSLRRRLPMLGLPLIFLWFAISIIGIRITVPRWHDDISLWTWSHNVDPYDPQSKDNLLYAYIHAGKVEQAKRFSDQLLNDAAPCANCMARIAGMSLDLGDLPHAEMALKRLQRSPLLAADRHLCGEYYKLTGRMLLMRNDPAEAKPLLSYAAHLVPDDPEVHSLLAKATAEAH